ncbi:Fur-regulated basic protein FbpA [Bacillus sp. 166amftsu]|nr:Fur-regulated basic protein FbpA [Bacillus sp. 166amftsu]SDZ40414.1 Fur-regulated basic protein A [Bacillus sp. 166amftsu]
MDRRELLIEILIQRNIFKLTDGRELYEGNSEELTEVLEKDGNNDD